MNAVPRHPATLREYLEALRDELKVQFRAVDIDRIVEEVEGHLCEAIDDAGAESEHDIAAVITGFGWLRKSVSPTENPVFARSTRRRKHPALPLAPQEPIL